MTNKIIIKNKLYDIPAVLNLPDIEGLKPAVILCHGTGSNKDEVGDLFIYLANWLAKRGIASIRFDFAGCGDSTAKGQDLTFYGEVDDTEKIYTYLCHHEQIDSDKIGILGFSQGARVMAEFLGRYPKEIKTAVSWSGACHDGIGVFNDWFQSYYEIAVENKYVKIPLVWREDLVLSKEWFEEIKASLPLTNLSFYEGNLLAISGKDDSLVPYDHAIEIANACRGKVREYLIIEHANHTFNVLEKDNPNAAKVVKETVDWFVRTLV
jgi:uncharacterized protein